MGETLVIENIADTDLQTLVRLARANEVSPAEQASRLLREGLKSYERRQLRSAFEAIAALSPTGVAQSDSTLIIRADRDR